MDGDNVAVLRAIVEYVQKSNCILEVKVMKQIAWPDLVALQKEMASNVRFRTIWIFPTEHEAGVTIVRVDFGGNVAYALATEAKLKNISSLAKCWTHVKFSPCNVDRNYARFSSSTNWNFWLIGSSTSRSENVPPPGGFSESTLTNRGMLAANRYLQTSSQLLWSHCSVFIFCGERDSGKLTELVHYMLESAGTNKFSCRTICVLQEEVEVLATVARICQERNELVGSTVGYKLTINTQVGEMNNIVFCTAQTLILSLVIRTFKKVVPILTHLIVDCSDQRPTGMGLLLSLVKQIMDQNTAIKLILLCTNDEVQSWMEFFKGALVMHLPYSEPTEKYAPNRPFGAEYHHLETILQNICTHDAVRSMKQRLPTVDNALKLMAELQLAYGHCGLNQSARDVMDALLKNCWYINEATPFTAVLLPILQHNRHMVDYQHSETRLTALMIACAKGYADVVRSLLALGANPYIVGKKSLYASDWCTDGSKNPCWQLMQTAHQAYTNDATARAFLLCETYHKLYNPYVVDQHLVVDIVLHIYKRYAPGNILVVLPQYYDVLECLKLLRRSQLERRRNVQFIVCHSLITEEEFKENNVYPDSDSPYPDKTSMYCVILLAGASLLELLPSLTSIHYVVDSGLKMHHAGDYAKGICIDRSCLATSRTCRLFMWLAQRICFMLYGKDRLSYNAPSKPLPLKAVPNVTPPETILTALLCRSDNSTPTMAYLCSALFGTCPTNIASSLQLLHQIGAIERPLTVPTSLGLLLSHLGITIHLGKALLYSILFRCVDPVLTIIAALKVGNPFIEPVDERGEKEIAHVKQSLHSRTYSDCMVLLRLWQQWNQCKNAQTDESMVKNYWLKTGAMEAITNARVELMSMLRVLGIVKCGRSHNTEALNINSTKWTMVKCCLAGGFYPQLAIADYEKQLLTTNCGTEVFKPHRLSVAQVDNLPAKWVIYTRKLDHLLNVKKDVCPPPLLLENTVITDWTVLLMCGIDKFDTLDSGNMQPRERNSSGGDTGTMEFIIDRKYTFQLPFAYFQAVSFIRRRLGQLFENFSHNLLRTVHRKESDMLVNYIGDILYQEDVSAMIACTLHDTRPKLKNSLPMGATWNYTLDMFDRL